jgi:hypothetical protein
MPLGSAANIASVASAAIGTGQLIAGAVQRKKAKGLELTAEDAEQRLELARMKRQAKAFETGAAYQNEYDQLQNVQRQQNINAARLSGGAAGAAIGGGARNALATNAALVKMAGQSRQMGIAERQRATAQMNKMVQRRDDLQLLKQSKLEARAEKNMEAGMANVEQAIATYAEGQGGSGGGDLSSLTSLLGGGGEGGDGSGGEMSIDPAMIAAIVQMFCWVAREVYGIENPKWLIFRHWLTTDAPKWLLNLYIKHGEKFAKYISNKPRLKSIIKFFMDRAVKKVTASMNVELIKIK